MTTLNELADRLEAASGADYLLDREIEKATRNRTQVPRYTASIDAAMTLVPTDPEIDGPMIWALDTNTCVGCEATIYLTDNDMGPEIRVEAATPALALAAAAIRALSSQTPSGGNK